jgi:hypothetical protein
MVNPATDQTALAVISGEDVAFHPAALIAANGGNRLRQINDFVRACRSLAASNNPEGRTCLV